MKTKKFALALTMLVVLALVVAVIWSQIELRNSREHIRDLQEQIISLESQNEGMETEIEVLKAAIASLNDRISVLKSEAAFTRGFLNSLKPDIEKLIELSQCVLCCDVVPYVIGMGPRLIEIRDYLKRK